MVFQLGDWVWVHVRKERFYNNAYKLNLPNEHNVSATFNVFDLCPFDVSKDSRINHHEEIMNDKNL